MLYRLIHYNETKIGIKIKKLFAQCELHYIESMKKRSSGEAYKLLNQLRIEWNIFSLPLRQPNKFAYKQIYYLTFLLIGKNDRQSLRK